MAKPKAPEWLRLAFRDGVDAERALQLSRGVMAIPAYTGANRDCWLAHLDERRHPCSGRLERAHLIPRQRVENALGAWMPLNLEPVFYEQPQPHLPFPAVERTFEPFPARDLILLAAWDPRNGVIACEHHHRRWDNHATPPLVIPAPELPDHMLDFIFDWGLETQAEDRFPNFIRY